MLLRRYIRHYRACTIRDIISRWAPRSENDTEAYIRSVATDLAIDADAPLRYEDSDVMINLARAMARVECGELLDVKPFQRGYNLA